MTLSFRHFAVTGSAMVFSRWRRRDQCRRRKPLSPAVQSLEPRLALSIATAADDQIQQVAAIHAASRSGPPIASIQAPAAMTYAAGTTLSFTVAFGSNVVVSGTPTLPVTIGDVVREVPYARTSGGKNLVFRTSVTAGDLDTDGIQFAGPIRLPGGAAIRTAAGADASTALPARLPNLRRVLVDAVGPGLVAIGAPTVSKKAVTVRARFNEAITVRGKPAITAFIGGQERRLVFQTARGNTATFSYPLKKGESAAEVVADSRITLPTGASIRDKAGNIAASLAPPTEIGLSAANIPENESAGTVVGVLSAVDADGARDRHTFVLVEGAGSTDNAAFNILRDQIRAKASFDFETKSSYTIRVRSTDQGGLSFEKTFTISVTNVNEAPTDIAASATSIAENAGDNAVVGTLGTVDPDAGNTFTYALVAGTGDTDNAAFNISGGQLRATSGLDFETKTSYSVRVRSSDQGGLFTEKQFTITVNDLAVEMAFVTVGDIGNSNDPATGNRYGAVNYEYRIGKYEVTIGQYAAFLNAVAKSDPNGLLNANMSFDQSGAGILRTGSSGGFTYSVVGPFGVAPPGADSPSNRPIRFVSWFDSARFANWMSNGQPTGAQGPTTTEDGAYDLINAVPGSAPAANVINPNTGAAPLFRIPTESEWYKAAYYKGGGTDAGYWLYATQSDTAPGNTLGDASNQANYETGVYAVTQSETYLEGQNYLTNVGAFVGSPSAYGTFDQTGNVWEWNDLNGAPATYRGLRGGNWYSDRAASVASTTRNEHSPSSENLFGNGFRLASPVAVP